MMFKISVLLVPMVLTIQYVAAQNNTTAAPAVTTAAQNVTNTGAAMVTTAAPTLKEATKIAGTMRITGGYDNNKVDEIINMATNVSKRVAEAFSKAIETAIKDGSEKGKKANPKCKVTKFRKGSLLVDFEVTADAADSSVTQAIVSSLEKAVESGSIGNLTTDTSYEFKPVITGGSPLTTVAPTSGANQVSMGTVTLAMAIAAVLKALF